MVIFFFLGFLGAIIFAFYFFHKGFKEGDLGPITKSQISETNISLNQEEFVKKPYVCGECGTGMDVVDYVCPQCMSKEKLKI